MKQLFLIIFLGSGFWGFSQAYPNYNDPHELKFNFGLFLATTTVDFSYEYYLSEDTSLGGTVYFDNDGTDYNGDFGIGPNFRAYFGYNIRSGFFAEAFGLYFSGDKELSNGGTGLINRNYNSFALGLGIGNKWVTRSQKFSLEIYGGFGRNINPEDFQDSFIYRGGLNVGFRF